MLLVSVQVVTSARTSLGYFAISGENVFHKTRRGHKLSSGRKRYPSPIKISVGRDKLLREF